MPPSAGTQVAPNPEDLRRKLDELMVAAMAAKGATKLPLLQQAMVLQKEISKIESGPDLQKLEELKAERDKLSSQITNLQTSLIEIGAMEAPSSPAEVTRRSRKQSGEGQVRQSVDYTVVHSQSPQGIFLAETIKAAGSISEQDLETKMAGLYKVSGSTGAGLRGLRDVWKLISFTGSPFGAVPEGQTTITYSWTATPEAVANYNAELAKIGRKKADGSPITL